MAMNVATLIPLVGPDFGAVGGSGQLRAIVGALLTYGLIVAVLMVVTCGATWAVASSSGSWQAASKAKTRLFVSLGGAARTGGALAWAKGPAGPHVQDGHRAAPHQPLARGYGLPRRDGAARSSD